MAENEAPTPGTPEAETTESSVPSTSAIAPAVALWQVVKDAASTKGLAVRDLVITELTQQEIIKRKDAVIVLLGKYEEKTKELKKAEGQGTWDLNANGDKIGDPKYSKEQVGVMKGLREEVARISQALTNFFEKNDTNKLYELAKK